MSRIATCPHCSTRLQVSEQITDKTLICPHCLANVDNPQPGFQIQAADIDTNVKRDVSVVSIILAVLIALCVLGIAIGAVSPGGDTSFSVLMFSFAALDLFVSIAIIRGMVRWGVSGVRTPSIARVVGYVFLALGTSVAVVIVFFFTCLPLALSKLKL